MCAACALHVHVHVYVHVHCMWPTPTPQVVQHHNKSNNRKWKMFHGPNGQPKVKSRAVAMRVQYGEAAYVEGAASVVPHNSSGWPPGLALVVSWLRHMHSGRVVEPEAAAVCSSGAPSQRVADSSVQISGEGVGKHSSGGGAPLPPPPRARPAATAVAASAVVSSSSSHRGRAARDSFHSDGSEDEAEEQWENYTHLLGSRSTTPPPRASAPGAATSKAGGGAGAGDHGAMHGGGGRLAAPLPVARAPTGASSPPSWLKGFLAGH